MKNYLLPFFLLATACAKKTTEVVAPTPTPTPPAPAAPTQLQVTAYTARGDTLLNCEIALYKSLADLKAKKAYRKSSTGIGKATVLFSDIDTARYYASAIQLAGCHNTEGESQQLSYSVKPNTLTKSRLVLSEKVPVRIVGSSNNRYQYYLNGTLQVVLPPNADTTIYLSPGDYTFRFLQKEGYALYPTDKSYNVKTECLLGATITKVEYPD